MTSSRLRGIFVPGLIALSSLVLALLAWQARTVVDDAYINFRIVENFLAGNGLTYNIDERIESGTSFLWTLLLAALRWLLRPWSVDLPWLSVYAGIVSGVIALAVASLASIRFHDRATPRTGFHVWAPAGSLVVLAVKPFREFIASGLEMGLILFWIALSALVLSAAEDWRHRRRALVGGAVLMGLGPLVRPDLAVLALFMLIAFSLSQWPDWRRMLTVVGSAAAIPVTVQVWRMGYYALLVPNTALAKEAFDTRWDQGWIYLMDFVEPYWLPVALAPVACFLVLLVRATTSLGARWRLVALVAGALVHALYIVRLGGDFMHARMLLPPLFALLVPVAVWPTTPPWPRRRSRAFSWSNRLLLGSLGTWALLCGFLLRVPYEGRIDVSGIADEVPYYRNLARHPNPVTPEDYREIQFVDSVRMGEQFRAASLAGPRLLLLDGKQWPLRAGLRASVVTTGGAIGIVGFVAGPMVHVADVLGLTDPLASRLILSSRGRPGHEKVLPSEWYAARFVASQARAQAAAEYPTLNMTVDALGCPALVELQEAISAPLTARRFLENVRVAARLTSLRLDSNPELARQRFCGQSAVR